MPPGRGELIGHRHLTAALETVRRALIDFSKFLKPNARRAPATVSRSSRAHTTMRAASAPSLSSRRAPRLSSSTSLARGPARRAATVPRAMSPPVRPDPRPLPSGTRLDAHLHVWPSPEDHTYSSGKEPPAALARNATPEALLERCAAANVHGALIVQPINLGFDHAYVADAIRRHPGRFVGCCLADPTVGGGGMDALAHLLVPEGPFRAVRFNPGLWPEGERMTNPVGRDMFRLAGERGAPVGFMCFHGLHLHVEDIKDLCAEFSNTPVLIDHFGFVKGADDPNWAALLSLAEFPNVSVKASAHFRVVPEGGERAWPYPSTATQLRQMVDAFGAERVVWGSDFPFVTEECGYERAAEIVANCGAALSPEETEAVMGGTLARMFPGGWF